MKTGTIVLFSIVLFLISACGETVPSTSSSNKGKQESLFSKKELTRLGLVFQWRNMGTLPAPPPMFPLGDQIVVNQK